MIKRKTVTISDNVFQTLYRVKDNQERLTCYDTIFKALFTNSPVKMSALSETVQLAVSCLMPELRKIQGKFKSGKTEKKLKSESVFLSCKQNGSETKQTEAEKSRVLSPDYLNSNSNINYIYNILISSSSNIFNKTTNYTGNALAEVLKQFKSTAPGEFKKFCKTINQVSQAEAVKINGVFKKNSDLLESVTELLLNPNGLEQIKLKYDELNKKSSEIKNKRNYEISALFNLSHAVKKSNKNQYHKKSKSLDYDQRTYSEEDYQKLYDDLDNIEV